MAELKIHVIDPPSSLNWESPRTLLWSTLKNHLIQDYAPIGHFFVELQVAAANEFGVNHVLTGMSRENAKESSKIVRSQKLGLSAFFYDFKGKLDSAADGIAEIAIAKKANRYQVLVEEVSEAEGQAMLQFIADWIAKGAFRHYGGGVRLHHGEGSGCAEFAIHFLSLRKKEYASLPEWDRGVWVPKKFMGDASKKISYLNLFMNGGEWATGSSDGVFYRVPDPELVSAWIRKGGAGATADLPSVSSLPCEVKFSAKYGPETMASQKEQWKKISLNTIR